MVDCITYALNNNLQIRIKRIEPKLREGDVKIARAEFAPVLSLNYILNDNTSLSVNSTLFSPPVSSSRTMDFKTGVSGNLLTGTKYNLEFINQKNKSNATYCIINPHYTAEPKITITQPLFKDFGIIVNQANIFIAGNNRQISNYALEETIMDIISKTKSTYYTYIYGKDNLSLTALSATRIADLWEINKARYEKGLISSQELLEIETAVAQCNKDLITAEGVLEEAEDNLKIITNLIDDPQLWDAKLELLDNPEVKVVEDVDLAEALEQAFKFRPDYRSAKIDLENHNIRIKKARNNMLPTLDLVGSWELNGLGKKYKAALRTDTEYKDWSAGFKFSKSLGGAEKTEYEQRKQEMEQALLSFKQLEQKIIQEVRDRLRKLKIQIRQVEAVRLAKEKEIQNYKAQKERFYAGQINTHDMLEYQDQLSGAELDYVKALIDYNVAVIELHRVEGITLVKNNILLEE